MKKLQNGRVWLLWVVSLTLLTALVTAPAQAQRRDVITENLSGVAMCKADLVIWSNISQQESELSKVGVALDDYANGRVGPADVKNRLQKVHDQVLKLRNQVYNQRIAPSKKYYYAACSASDSHVRTSSHAIELINKGRLTRKALTAFQDSEASKTQEVLERWLKVRQNLAASLAKDSLINENCRNFYAWQNDLLVWEELERQLTDKMQGLLSKIAQGYHPDTSGLYDEGQAIAKAIGKIEVSKDLQEAKSSSYGHALALAKLAKAVETLAGDPSSESVTRVSRLSRQVGLQYDNAVQINQKVLAQNIK